MINTHRQAHIRRHTNTLAYTQTRTHKYTQTDIYVCFMYIYESWRCWKWRQVDVCYMCTHLLISQTNGSFKDSSNHLKYFKFSPVFCIFYTDANHMHFFLEINKKVTIGSRHCQHIGSRNCLSPGNSTHKDETTKT